MKERAKRDARVADLRKQGQVLRDEIERLETISEREDAEPWIGECFKYRNRDSGGETWWLYLRVLAHEDGGAFTMLKCESQSTGWHIAVEERLYLMPDPFKRGYIRITRPQFDAAWRQFVKRVSELNT